jgi:UDP-N-acetylglucosamine transferase subunit ALG13
MIFVTIGTAEPFDRLVRAADALQLEEEVVIQCGLANIHPTNARAVPFIPFDDLRDYIRRARVVVSAAGVGTVMTVLMEGKEPVVVPRLRRHHEAADDHQLVFARRIAQAGLVTLVEDENRLADVIVRKNWARKPIEAGDGQLAAEIRTYLRQRIETVADDALSLAMSER